MIKMIGDHVLLKPRKKEQVGGIYLPEAKVEFFEVVDVGDGKVLIKVRSEYVQETTQQQQATREAHVVENSIVKTQVKFVFYKKWQQYKPLQVVEIPRDLAEKLQSEGYGEIVQE